MGQIAIFLLGYKYIILIFICLFSVIVLISKYTADRTNYENDCKKYNCITLYSKF